MIIYYLKRDFHFLFFHFPLKECAIPDILMMDLSAFLIRLAFPIARTY